MRLIFAGTPHFAQTALRAIIAAGFEVVLVLTREDQPAGRGQRLQASPVKQTALEHSIPVLQPKTLRDASIVQALADCQADAMVVAAYGRILPPDILRIPRLGCLNIHASLLPRWRGAAPIQRALEAGDTETGITIMQMDAGLDTGAMLHSKALSIAPDENAASLHDRLQALGADCIVEVLGQLGHGALTATPQPEQGVTYAKKIEKSEAVIDWAQPAAVLCNRIRAFDPFPGCSTRRAGGAQDSFKVWRATVVPKAPADHRDAQPAPAPRAVPAPGTIIQVDGQRLIVQSGAGTRLALQVLQRPGAKRLPVAEFLKGFTLTAGETLV